MSYNFQIVIAGTTALGISCGVLGVFMFHQKQSLISDALSHATLPGIAIAYLVLVGLGLPERSLTAFIIGALVSAGICIVLYRLLQKVRSIHSDAVIAILLSSFFGFGIALLGIIQKQPRGHAAGLGQYIYGDTASMLRSDVLVIAGTAAVSIAMVVVVFKEIVATTFDREYARSIGIRTRVIEGLLLGATVCMTVVGLQAVGLILMISFFIIPALAARYWTTRIIHHLIVAALIAVISAVSGTVTSSLWNSLPTGAAIVLSAGVLFAFSIIGGTHNGLLVLFFARRTVRREFNLIQLLIALRFHLHLDRFSLADDKPHYLAIHGDVTLHWIADHLQIDVRALRHTMRHARARGFLTVSDRNSYKITAIGVEAMHSAVYRHELINAGMLLFPAKTAYLQETSDARADKLFTADELRQLTEYLRTHHPYLITHLPNRAPTPLGGAL